MRKSGVLLIIIFIAGIATLLYPSISSVWNTIYQRSIINSYQDILEQTNDYEYEREKARAYNDKLWPTPTPEGFAFLDDDEPAPEYTDCLNIAGDGIMGYVEIPKINVKIPIYHTTDEEMLQNGAGHLEGTSLPIGGESTHTVIAAHRGLPGHTLFSNLDKVDIGDHFVLYVLDDTLTYEVDDINVVDPEDVSNLVIIEGEDLCTLLTCTPYGVNTERLLVRGHRVDNGEIDESMTLADNFTWEKWLLLAGLVIAAVGIVVIVHGRKK